MQGMDLSFGLSSDNTQSFGAKAKMMNKDKAWTEAIASIIGREVVNIAVQQTLEIVGGLIANAEISEDGTLTEKGRAFIQAGKIITRQLHDFDNGHSYGVGINLSKGISTVELPSLAQGIYMVKIQSNNSLVTKKIIIK
jgi:hypothetical protein